MSVEGVIFDVSDTLLTRTNTAVPGTIAMVDRLRGAGVQIIAVHNNGPRTQIAQRLAQAGFMVDLVVTRQSVGISKGSPRWIDWIMGHTGLARHELFYVGDSRYDMITASHSRVVYAHALWANSNHAYGLPAPAPGWVAAVVLHIFRKQHPWAWQYTYQNDQGARLRLMALVDGNGAGDHGLKQDLITLLKDYGHPSMGLLSLREFVVLHLLASIVTERLYEETDVWTSYPSRDGVRRNRLAQALDLTAKLFRDAYLPDLLERHTPAQHSRAAFHAGGIAGAIDNQLTTTRVHPRHAGQLDGKTVLLLDDFLTRGCTTGVGHLALRGAGATDVVIVAVGKYGPWVHILGRPMEHHWDGIQLPPFTGQDVPYDEVHAAFAPTALAEFAASYQAMRQEHW